MFLKNFGYFCMSLLTALIVCSSSEAKYEKNVTFYNPVGVSVNKFALDILLESYGRDNFVFSPFSMWSLLALTMRGSTSRTFLEIRKVLHIPAVISDVRASFCELENSMQAHNSTSVDLVSINGLFADSNWPVNPDFIKEAKQIFNAYVVPIDFTRKAEWVSNINSWVTNATHKRIKSLLDEGDLQIPQLVLANAVFFKGLWKYPFDRNFTMADSFFDERGKEIAKVQMMVQTGNFLYGYLEHLQAHVVELPYEGDNFCMLLVLPQMKTSLEYVLRKILNSSVEKMFADLINSHQAYDDDEIQVIVPRFEIMHEMIMNNVLRRLGMNDAFTTSASFPRLSPSAYIAKIIHKAEIEVQEEGTIATAATGIEFSFKMPSAKFYANRPFAFFLLERKYSTVLFAGTVYKPVYV